MITCKVTFAKAERDVSGTVRVSIAHGGALVGLAHAEITHGGATIKVREHHVASHARLTITLVIDRPHQVLERLELMLE